MLLALKISLIYFVFLSTLNQGENIKKFITIIASLILVGVLATMVVLLCIPKKDEKLYLTIKNINIEEVNERKIEIQATDTRENITSVDYEGYNFINYYIDESCSQVLGGQLLKEFSTIYAKYEKMVFTVNYIVDQATYQTSQIAYKDKASYLDLSGLTQYEGFDNAWYTDIDCTVVYNFDSEVKADITLYTKAVFSAEEIAKYTTQTNAEETEVTLTAYADGDATDIIIPSYIDGKPVTKLGSGLFAKSTGKFENLKKIVVPNTVKELGGGVFSLLSLDNLKLSNSLEKIDASTFVNMEIDRLEFPKSLKTINGGSLGSIKAKELIFEEGTILLSNKFEISSSTTETIAMPGFDNTKEVSLRFYDLSKLKDIVWNYNGYKSINKNTTGQPIFVTCPSINVLEIPEGIEEISMLAANCSANTIKIPSTLKNCGFLISTVSTFEEIFIPKALETFSTAPLIVQCPNLKSVIFEKDSKLNGTSSIIMNCPLVKSIDFNMEFDEPQSRGGMAIAENCSGLLHARFSKAFVNVFKMSGEKLLNLENLASIYLPADIVDVNLIYVNGSGTEYEIPYVLCENNVTAQSLYTYYSAKPEGQTANTENLYVLDNSVQDNDISTEINEFISVDANGNVRLTEANGSTYFFAKYIAA